MSGAGRGRPAAVLQIALALLLPPCVRPAAAQDAPAVQDVVLSGVSVYAAQDVLRLLGVEPGRPLPLPAEALASRLEQRYHADGFVAARVSAVYEPQRRVLIVTADEGRIAETAVAGLDGAAERRALAAARVEIGQVLRRDAVWDALGRLEQASAGALRADGAEDPYAFERLPDGVRLVLRPRRVPARLQVGPGLAPAGSLYNRIDGAAPGLALGLSIHDLSGYRHLQLYARGHQGLASGAARWAVGARRAFGGAGALSLGYELHDLADTEDAFRASALEETLGTLLFASSFRDAFRRRGHEAYAALRVGRRLQLGLGGRSERQDSLDVAADGSLFRRSAAPRPNPRAEPGRMRSLLASLRAGSRALFDDAQQEAESFPLRDVYELPGPRSAWAARATLEATERAEGRGGFRRFVGHARAHRFVGPTQLDSRLLAGLSGGALPPQKRFALGGLGTLRGHHFKEFSGEQMLLWTLEWSLDLPGAPELALFYDGGAVWTDGRSDAGWRDDLGVGLGWGVRGARLVRIDLAFPRRPQPGRDRARLSARLQAAF